LDWAEIGCTGVTPDAAKTGLFLSGNLVGGERNKHVCGADFPAQINCDKFRTIFYGNRGVVTHYL
jgi:hypothetical protein